VTATTIASIIEQSCVAKGKAEFIADENLNLTGEELWQCIHSVAGNFKIRGLSKGDVLAFYCGSSVSQAVTFFACLVSGIIPCCLHVRETTERNRKNIDYIKAKKIIADPGLLVDAAALMSEDKILSLTAEFIATPPPEELNLPDLNPDDPALILISSGTTGVPKCILHSQATLAATAKYGPYSYDCWSPEDSTIVVMDPSFAAWIHTVLPFIFIKGRVLFRGGFDPAEFLKTLAQEKTALAPLVPTVWRMVMAAEPEKYDLSHLKTAFYSGEPGSESLVEDLRAKICVNVMTSYLSSEGGDASGVVAGTDILSVAGQATSTGRPVKDAEMRIIDPEGTFDDELSTGEIGEIAVKSASVAIGYFGDPGLTMEKFSDGWWRSGDLGFIDERGLVYVKGRLDNRINTGGIKVHAEEVEAALLKHPGVQLAAVVGESDPLWGEHIEAHLVVIDEAPSESELLEFCLEEELLPKTHLPKIIHFHQTLPTGPTGKLYRRGLKS
jgi:acyl-CoA synthetase (AMP-forming)/AMP-acid ligase II